jgi:hypothetical protein
MDLMSYSRGPPASDQPAHARWFRRRATVAATASPWRPGEQQDRACADGTSSDSKFLHGRHADGSRHALDPQARKAAVARLASATHNRYRAETLIRGGLKKLL